MSITLSPSQQSACDAFRTFLQDPAQKSFLLSGFAGSGKTFLVTYLLDLVADEFKMIKLIAPKSKPYRYHYSATTNKAATVLSTMTQDSEAQTIHKLLGLQLMNDFSTGKSHLITKNECVNLSNSIVIIDEASMITQELLDYIEHFTKNVKNCKLLYVGDSYQLPPVHETICPIFRTSKNTHFLTDIVRQLQGSPIITLSQKYRDIVDHPETKWPEIIPDNQTIFFHEDGPSWQAAMKQAYEAPHAADDLRVLGWTNHRIRLYNSWIRNLLGFKEPFCIDEIVISNNPIIHDRRIRARTDSLHSITDIDVVEKEGIVGHRLVLQPLRPMYGGSGQLGEDRLTVFQPSDWTQVRKLLSTIAIQAKENHDWGAYFKIKNEWTDLRPIHAQTVHKSQGSTYKTVFVDINDIGSNNKWYEVARLMYVAITRASHKVHLYGKLTERYTRKDPLELLGAFKDVC